MLSLKVCDKAVGSGHFLVGAAHRLARHLARIRALAAGESEPSPLLYQTALRDVIGHCLYGVDINPMSVELCKVTLWLEALEPGKPLSFLAHHIRCGNSLLGATPDLVANGIPDDAFKPIEGDDKQACSELKKRNSRERRGLGELFAREDAGVMESLQQAAGAIDELPDNSPEAVHRKEEAFREAQSNYNYLARKTLFDTWCAAFVIRKHFVEGDGQPVGITQRLLNDLASGGLLAEQLREAVNLLADQYQFFHWHLAFPEVFAQGGFDVSLGNPPWDMQEVKDNEFFAASFPEILSVKSAKDKSAVLARIRIAEPVLWRSYQEYVRVTYGQRHFMANSGRFPLAATGRMNLYRLFLETCHSLVGPSGRVGIVLPSGFASDSFSQDHFAALHGEGRLVSLYDFENRFGLFPEVHKSFRFCLLTIGGNGVCTETDFVFFAHSVLDLADSDRHVRLSQQAVSVLNPLSRTAPLFRSRRDYALTLMLQYVGVIIGSNDGERLWRIKPTLMFMMNAEMKEHRTAEELQVDGCRLNGNCYFQGQEVWLPFYEGKMVGMYDHRAASIRFDPTNRVRRNQSVDLSEKDHQDPAQLALPMFWLNSIEVADRCACVPKWCLTVKDVTSSTNERTSIAAILAGVALTDSLPWLRTEQPASMVASLLANLNAFPFDYAARQKVAGLHLRGHYLAQLPIIGIPTIQAKCSWAEEYETVSAWILPRVLELTYTAWDLEPFAQDCGWSGPPFRWNDERRFLLRCELDAAFFHLYLGSEDEWRKQPAALTEAFPTPRDAVSYIMDTFPIVKRKDEAAHGTYRTKDTILEIYDALAETMQPEGVPFVSSINPPPATLATAHRWSWRDLPMVLPDMHREPLPLAYQYVVTLITELVLQSGGSLPWVTLRVVTDLLTDRNKLARLAEARFGKVGANWGALNGDIFDASQRFDQLSGLCHAGRMRVVSQDSDLVVELLTLDQHLYFPHVRFDARLALAVVDELTTAIPDAKAQQEWKKVASLVPA